MNVDVMSVISVHIYPSTFEYETRILKVTKTLIEQTAVTRVIVIAVARPGLPARAEIDGAREVRRFGSWVKGERFLTRTLRFMEWSVRVLWGLRRERIDIVNCHSLSVLPLCVVLKVLHQSILIYEPHELETETATFTGVRRKLAKLIERILIRQAAAVIVVSPSIAQHYHEDYGLRDVVVVLNVPERGTQGEFVSNPIFRRQYNIPDEHLIFMFQGAFDDVRGVGLLLAAFKSLPADRHIVFLGFGPMEEEIRTAAIVFPNIHVHSAVPPAQVINYTLGADIGFALLDDSCLNHQYALPNKLFHYLHAGLPVIVSDLKEMGSLVDAWQCGWRVANTADAIAARVASITPEAASRAAEAARCSRLSLSWENEATKLVTLYRAVLAQSHTESADAPAADG